MPESNQQPLHEVVRALLSLRTLLHGHTGAWWALGQELDARYGQQEVEAEIKRQLDVRHGYVEADLARVFTSGMDDVAMPAGGMCPHCDGKGWNAHAGGRNRCQPCLGTGRSHITSGRPPTGGSGMRTKLVKPKPPRGRIQKESEPPPEAGAQMCHVCNGTGEVQAHHGSESCWTCNGKGTVAQ